LKKFISTILTTSTAAIGLLVAGAVTANADTTYTVKAGDCVWAISQKYGSTIAEIETANQIQNNLIFPSQILTIPGVDGPATRTDTSAAITSTSQAKQPTQESTVAVTPSTTPTAPSTPTRSVVAAVPESSTSVSYTGNNLQSYVLTQMAARTGVSAGTWNHIITRESGWQPQIKNGSSGAYGLFQNIHISSGSVNAQVNAAVALYREQGMDAWAL